MASSRNPSGQAVQAGAPGAGHKAEFEAFEDYYRPVHVKQLVMIAVPEGTTRVAMLER